MVDALRQHTTWENYEAVWNWLCDEGKDASAKDRFAASQSLKNAWEVLREFQPHPSAKWCCCAGEASRQSGAASSQDASVGQSKGRFQ